MFRLAGEVLAEVGVLCGDADRAGIEVALAEHAAAHGDQGAGCDAPFVGTEQGCSGHVAAGLDLAVGLNDYAAAEAVGDEHLLRFGEAQLPGEAGMLDCGEG